MISHNPTTSTGDTATAAADHLSDVAQDALQSTRRGVDHALEGAESGVQRAHERIAPAVSHLADQAESLARRGADAVRDTGHQVRQRAAHARERAAAMTDRTAGYVRDEPLKSMLIAAAAGAAVMALVSLLGSRSKRYDD